MMDFDGTPSYYTMANEPDLILHPAAHAWGDWAWEKPTYLEAALKRCRDRKRAAK